MTPDPALDAEVRRVDEDRWLASRFASADVRARLVAIYALNHEIARTADVVTQAAIGDIRLQWWREALAELFDRKRVRAHPVLAALAEAHRETPLPRDALEGLIDTRSRDLDGAPFPAFAEIDTYLEGTGGNVMRVAAAACGAHLDAKLVSAATRAWGYAGLLRAAAHWRAKGRSVLPHDNADPHAMVERARSAYVSVRAQIVPAEAFPAIGYVTLTPLYLHAVESGRTERALFTRQLKLVAASATGRL